MNKINLYLCVFLLCYASISCKHVKVNENGIEELERPKLEDCKPKPTYVNWSEMRTYLNEYFKLNLPLSITGLDLVVMRCRCYLAPCNTPNSYCGVETENKRKVRIPLEYQGEKFATVVITFLEDERCNCYDKEWYNFISYHDVSEVPVILDAFLVEY